MKFEGLASSLSDSKWTFFPAKLIIKRKTEMCSHRVIPCQLDKWSLGHHLKIWWSFHHLLVSVRYDNLENFIFLLQGDFEICPFEVLPRFPQHRFLKYGPFLKTHKSLIHYIINLQFSAMVLDQKYYRKNKIWQSQN